MATTPPTDDPWIAPAPTPLTPLVGREREVELALALVRRADIRLLTLTGPGGIGKTRLALQVAAELAPDFAGGVRFAPLAAVPDAALVAATVARAAGLLDTGDAPIREALAAAIRDTETLLVLDNFEHVVAATPLVSELLDACPRLKILVTSRVLLRVDGEHAMPVPPLLLPDPRAATSFETVAEAAAVQLFAQRGQAVNPSFDLTPDNAPLVAEICQRLDGLPLAIELAAARVTHLSLPTLRDRLHPRLPLLTGGGRDRPLRLQTMRDAIAWSHDLLTPDEQTLFRRLAVFSGGCTLEAAEWVTGDGLWVMGDEESSVAGQTSSATPPITHNPQPITLDLIAALVDASLLHAESDGHGTTRYRMLETIRDYADEQLAASGEEDRIRERHTAWFADFAARRALAGLLPGAPQVLALMEAEHANLRATLAWLAERDDARTFLRVAAALAHFWIAQGHYHEGRGWLERALAHGGDTTIADRARALVALGLIEVYQGANQEAEPRLAEGLAACREGGEAFSECYALLALGTLAILQRDQTRAAALLEASLAAANAVPDQRLAGIMTGRVLINLAVISRANGDYALAAEQLETALRLHHDAGYPEGTILALGDLGDLARDQSDHEHAMACYREALGLGQDNPRTRVVTDVIESVGILATAAGEAERGATLLGAAEALRDRIGLRLRFTENQAALEHAVATTRAALGEQRFAAAWIAGRNLTPGEAMAAARAPLAFRTGASAAGVSLTPREQEILGMIAAGMTDRAIAAALFVSVRTVENHVSRMLAKLGVRTRAAAVTAAITTGLITPPSISST